MLSNRVLRSVFLIEFPTTLVRSVRGRSMVRLRIARPKTTPRKERHSGVRAMVFTAKGTKKTLDLGPTCSEFHFGDQEH
jgi:hypothetical protein